MMKNYPNNTLIIIEFKMKLCSEIFSGPTPRADIYNESYILGTFTTEIFSGSTGERSDFILFLVLTATKIIPSPFKAPEFDPAVGCRRALA